MPPWHEVWDLWCMEEQVEKIREIGIGIDWDRDG
jgi:hypothetical protein